LSLIRDLLLAPNQLTLLRLIFVPFIIIAVLDGHWHWALGLFITAGVSDGLDGLLARRLHQQTELGRYLDPIADKLLMSTLFLVLSIIHGGSGHRLIPWRYTVLVFSRDVCILLTCAVLYMVANFRDFRPSIFGKLNTTAQVGAIFFVLFYQIDNALWIYWTKRSLLWLVFALTLVSGIHYIIVTGHRLRAHQARGTAAR
jgi:cardiolipin synthase